MSATYTWPDYVEKAFRTFYYGGQYEKPLEAFVLRWGALDVPTFTHTLTVGTEEDKVLALLALGYSGVSQARDVLLPYLQSANPMERWASALCLGELKEEQALPELIRMLDEFLLPRPYPLECEGGLYHFWRIKTAFLLGEWQRSDLAPVLRNALKKAGILSELSRPITNKCGMHIKMNSSMLWGDLKHSARS